eukprot:symbB.v1.2.016240.t1/scaffold1233.1/size237523/2
MQVGTCGLASNTILLNSALSYLSDATKWKSAEELYYQSLKTLSFQCDVVTGNNMISACQRGGQWRTCLQRAGEMKQNALKIDTVTQNVVLAAFAGSHWILAMDWLRRHRDGGLQPTPVTFGTAISVYHDCQGTLHKGYWESSLQLAEQVRKSALELGVVLCNAAMASCERGCRWLWSATLLTSLSQLDCQHNMVSLAALSSACDEAAEVSCWQRSFVVLDRVPQWLVPEISSRMRSAATACFNTAMSASGKVRQWFRSFHLVEALVVARLSPSSTTVTCLLTAAGGDAEDVALGLVTGLLKKVRPDMFHLNALLGSLGRRAAWRRAMHAVRAATAFDAVSARATWAALPREEWRQAVGSTEYFGLCQGSVASYNTLIDCCVDAWAVAFQLLSLLLRHALVPDTVSHNAVLQSCDSDQWCIAIYLLHHAMHEKDVITYTSIFSSLSSSFGRWKHILALLSDMRLNGLQASKLTCLAAMDSFGQGLWSGDRSRDFSTPAANQFVSRRREVLLLTDSCSTWSEIEMHA